MLAVSQELIASEPSRLLATGLPPIKPHRTHPLPHLLTRRRVDRQKNEKVPLGNPFSSQYGPPADAPNCDSYACTRESVYDLVCSHAALKIPNDPRMPAANLTGALGLLSPGYFTVAPSN